MQFEFGRHLPVQTLSITYLNPSQNSRMRLEFKPQAFEDLQYWVQ